MTCPKKITQAMQISQPRRVSGKWFVTFSVVFNDGSEGYVNRQADDYYEIAQNGGKANSIEGLHFHPPELVFSQYCNDCQPEQW